MGWIEEIPGVNAQEKMRGELLDSLKVILAEALEFNCQDARDAASDNFTEETVSVLRGVNSLGISGRTVASFYVRV